jgi:methyl halide transferase
MMDPNLLSAEYWDRRYQEGSTPWNLGVPAPPLVSLLASPNSPTPGRIAVLGCGTGYDALLFAEHGFEVVGFDLSALAIEAAKSVALERGLTVEFLERDIFALIPEFSQSFDRKARRKPLTSDKGSSL